MFFAPTLLNQFLPIKIGTDLFEQYSSESISEDEISQLRANTIKLCEYQKNSKENLIA